MYLLRCSLSPFSSINRTVGPGGPFFPSCIPGTLLNSATYAQALSHVATLKGEYYSPLPIMLLNTHCEFNFLLIVIISQGMVCAPAACLTPWACPSCLPTDVRETVQLALPPCA